MTANSDFWEDDSYLPEQRFMEEHAARAEVTDVGEVVLMFGDGALLPDIHYVMTGKR